MSHRIILTERQRNELIALPTSESLMIAHYVLSEDDIIYIRRKRNSYNQLGFALQLCALRYPGRYLQADDILPQEMVKFIGAQLGLSKKALSEFSYKPVTRYEHLRSLQKHFTYSSFHNCETEFVSWLEKTAINTRNNAELAELFVEKCREQKIILPGITVIERLCADARVSAERKIVEKISSRIDVRIKRHLYAMLDETVDGRLTVHGWLKRFEVGHNSADVNRLLDRLEYLKKLDIPDSLLADIPAHRVLWLRQQGETYYADGLRDINEARRLAILATCAIEWKFMITDAILETHDRIVGKIYNDAKRMSNDQISSQGKLTNKTLSSFVKLSRKLLKGHRDNASISDILNDTSELETLMLTATALTKKLESDPLEHVVSFGYGKFRRYAQRMLENIVFQSNEAAKPLHEAIALLKKFNCSNNQKEGDLPVNFANTKWSKNLGKKPERKLWETAILFIIRDNLRSRDIWVCASRAYQDTRQQLLPVEQAKQTGSLPISLDPTPWITKRTALLEKRVKEVSRMVRQGDLPNSCIDKGKIRISRLDRKIPENMDMLTLELYKKMPEISVTDILQEVDKDIGFTDSFTHIHNGSPCADKVGLLNVLLAGGINMGLKKMALCSSSHTSFWSLMRISSWHVTNESITEALATVIEQHKNLPLSTVWGDGTTSSSDGQFMATGGTGEAMNVINAKYGNTPGIKAYTHISDQYGPFALKTIPATAHEAPYILDGLTMNDTGKRIKEHYADTGGFTDHVFAMCALLGYQFAPRLRNLSSLRLFSVENITVPNVMKELVNAKANLGRIKQQWPDILRIIASIITQRITPSDILRQLASFPKQNELAVALREIGRIERTIFILTWISSVALQRRAQMGLNKGEAHHALKRALNFNRRGEITDRTSENQNLRMMYLNLLTAIIIYWNTKHLGQIIQDRKQKGENISRDQLEILSPLGWEHIILTGFYKW